MIRFLLIIAGIIGLVFGNTFVRVGSAWWHGESERSQIERILPEVMRSMNKKLPRKVDEATTLLSVKSNGTRVTYTYWVDTKRFRVDGKQIQNVKTNLAQRACADLLMRRALAAGAVFEHRYYNNPFRTEDQRFISSFDVAIADC